ncbi:hypothetical protein GB937_010844 [Aspergillus fischeri]|nr:hypothetical protein GB937_010844 [Aspergillus fischeri]
MVDWLRKTACENGVEYIQNKVVDISLEGNHSGEEMITSTLVNAAEICAHLFSWLEGKDLPIEARLPMPGMFTTGLTYLIIMLSLALLMRLVFCALACGRCVAELAVHGEYQMLDMSEIRYERIAENRPLTE